MNLVLLAVLLVKLCIAAQSATVPDPAMAARIDQLTQAIFLSDDKDEAAADTEVRKIFTQHGLPSVAQVGEQKAATFVTLAVMALGPGLRSQLIEKVKDAVGRNELPMYLLTSCQVRTRLDAVREAARKQPPANPELRDQIESLIKGDQAVRQKEGFNLKKVQQMDQKNAAPLLTILEKYGVPTYSMVGPEAANDFALMLQHQSLDFLRRELPRLKANVDAGQADPESYALAYDRMQIESGKKQLYGMRLVCNPGEEMHEAPMEDAANVNQRRAELGLMPLELYVYLAGKMNSQFCPPVATGK